MNLLLKSQQPCAGLQDPGSGLSLQRGLPAPGGRRRVCPGTPEDLLLPCLALEQSPSGHLPACHHVQVTGILGSCARPNMILGVRCRDNACSSLLFVLSFVPTEPLRCASPSKGRSSRQLRDSSPSCAAYQLWSCVRHLVSQSLQVIYKIGIILPFHRPPP